MAAIDPLAGLMAMDPLPRIRWLLRNHAGTEAAAPLLEVLAAAAVGSPAAAEAVVRSQGMCDAISSILGPGYGGSGSGSSGSGESSSGSSGASAALRVSALRLVRLLAQASPLAAQLLRTAGLLTAAQAALLRGPPGAGAAEREVACDALMRLEALRIWRVAAAQGVCFMHMDMMFQSVCSLLEPPPTDPGGASSAALIPTSAAAAAAAASRLQWQLRGEALQLLETLAAHALKATSGAGDPTIGAEMISPECVAAVTGTVAAAWAPGGVLEEAARKLVSQADVHVPFQLEGDEAVAAAAAAAAAAIHPAQLMPAAHARLAALAAAWHLIATTTAGPGPGQRQVVTEAWGRLTAAGVAAASSGGGAAAAGTGDALALALLQGSQDEQQHRAAVSGAFVHHLEHLASSQPGDGSSGAGGGDAEVASACLSTAAASALAALCRLEAVTRAAADTAFSPHRSHAQRCAAVAADALAGRAARHSAALLVLEPWQYAWLQTAQPLARLLLQAAALMPSTTAADADTSGSSSSSSSSNVAVFDGLLSLMILTPPGLEAQSLSALQLAFGAPCSAALGQVCAAASAELQALQKSGCELSAAAAGQRAAAGGGAPSGRVAYPAPASFDADTLAGVLREGYAAGWLSIIPRDRLTAGVQQKAAAAAAAVAPLPPPPVLRRAAADDPHGSRLPAPQSWMAAEALAVPGGPANPSSSSSSSSSSAGTPGAAAPHPTAAALALTLGCGALGLQCAAAAPAPARLRTSIEQAYLADAFELLPPVARGSGGRGGQGAAERTPAWEDAAARWGLAALTWRLAGRGLVSDGPQQGGSSSSSSSWDGWLGPMAIDRLSRLFAESSMGDPLLGAHLALLLAPASGPAARRAVWSALAGHSALHLLPPPAGCLGGGAPYLAGPFAFAFVAQATKSLTQGDLAKSLQLGSVSAAIALHAIAAASLDPAAWAREDEALRLQQRQPSGGGAAAPAVDAAGRAVNVLRGVVRAVSPDVVVALFATAKVRGLDLREARRAVVLACQGDSALMERAALVLRD